MSGNHANFPSVHDSAGLHDPSGQGYSHVALIPRGAAIAFVSGQYASGSTAAVVSPHFEVQIRQAFSNLRTAIAGAGAMPRHVAKLTGYIVDHSDVKLPLLGAELVALFGDYRPAMTLVPVPKLALDSILFEVEAMLVLP